MAAPRAVSVVRLPTAQRVVALTFDAGARRGEASQVLDTLSRMGAKASFALTGKWAQANPDLARRMAADGSTMVNHTYDHPSFTGVSAKPPMFRSADRDREIRRADYAIQLAAGISPTPYFRPAYGDFDACTLRVLRANGYKYNFLWSTDSGGWRGLSSDEVERRVMAGLKPGAIYVLHVNSSGDVGALPSIIRRIRERGYQFATLGTYFR